MNIEQAFNNMINKTSKELEQELKQERLKALEWYTDNWEKVKDEYWNQNGETLSKNFCLDNLQEDELADFILDNFYNEIM